MTDGNLYWSVRHREPHILIFALDALPCRSDKVTYLLES
jgi:hypothetical protein